MAKIMNFLVFYGLLLVNPTSFAMQKKATKFSGRSQKKSHPYDKFTSCFEQDPTKNSPVAKVKKPHPYKHLQSKIKLKKQEPAAPRTDSVEIATKLLALKHSGDPQTNKEENRDSQEPTSAN